MKQRGFTLIEVMIVLIILSILGAIFYSAFRGIREQAAREVLRQEFTRRDLSDCDFLGLDESDLSVYRCSDGKLYTDR